MSKEYKMNIEELMDEYMLEPMEYEIGNDFDLYPIGTKEEELSLSVFKECKLKAIEKISDSQYKLIATIVNSKVHDYEINVSKDGTFETTIVSSADCVLGLCLDDCLFKINEISENKLVVQIIGVDRLSVSELQESINHKVENPSIGIDLFDYRNQTGSGRTYNISELFKFE